MGGLPPFHFWVLKVLSSLSLTDLCFFVGPLKSGYLWLLVSTSATALFLVFFSLIIGILLLWNTSTVQLLLFGSGLCQSFIFVCLGPRVFPLYFRIYILALFGFFKTWLPSSSFHILGQGPRRFIPT